MDKTERMSEDRSSQRMDFGKIAGMESESRQEGNRKFPCTGGNGRRPGKRPGSLLVCRLWVQALWTALSNGYAAEIGRAHV